MELLSPFYISSRLCAAVKIGGVEINLELDELNSPTRDNRDRYQYTFIFPDGAEVTGNDLQTGVGGNTTMARMFSGLLCFLSACAESRQHATRYKKKVEDTDLFPEKVGEWAEANSDEISMLLVELEENPENFIRE